MATEISGAALKAWRRRMRLKVYEAAAALGVSADTYGRIERRARVDRRTALACAAISHGLPPVSG